MEEEDGVMVHGAIVTELVPNIVLLCSFCGKVHNDAGGWEQADGYEQKHPYVYFSHGLCPECAELYFPNEYADICRQRKREESIKSAQPNGLSRVPVDKGS
jgi:hypothetical protein